MAGNVRSNLIKGNTRVFYERPEREGPQEFKVVRGNVEVSFAGEAAAEFKAEVTDGRIEVAEGLGLKPEKAPVGLHAAGRIGPGGKPVFVQVVNGDVRLKK